MRNQIRLYFRFTALLLCGFVLGVLLRERFGLAVLPPVEGIGDEAFSLRSVLSCYLALICPPLLVFLLGYTLFSRPASALIVLYVGAVIGSGEGHLQEGDLLSRLLFALLLTLFLVLCAHADAHRQHLKSVAPELSRMLASRATKEYLSLFLLLSSVYLMAAVLLAWGI